MLNHNEIMWVETWPNLVMKMRDMPYWHYNSSEKKGAKREEGVPGDTDILKRKFGKYIK